MTVASERAAATFAYLPLDAIQPNPNQPRTVFDEDALAQLADSIRDMGVLQPILVTRDPHSTDEAYLIVAGERRWRASQLAGQETIPAVIREPLGSDPIAALAENLHRADLNPIEEAVAYRALLDERGYTQVELAQHLKVSRARITHALGFLRLPEEVQSRVAAGVLSFGHARALVGVVDPERCALLARRAIAEGMTVRNLEELVALEDDLVDEEKPRRQRQTSAPSALMADIADRLQDTLDTRVRIQGGRRGRIVVEYAGEEDLARLVDLIAPRRRRFEG